MREIEWGHLLLSFDGRINRAQFWLGVLLLNVVTWSLATVGMTADSAIVWSIGTAIGVFVVWTGLALSIKRWHDRDKSGWWVFISLVPFIGPVWSFLEMGFFPGTPGTNDFGADPLG
ncbi:MAG: DUF805 domain-containing protein [Actinomycetota bacterium]